MREAYIIEKKALVELYNGRVYGYKSWDSPSGYVDMGELSVDELEVHIFNAIGPFIWVRIMNTADPYNRLIIPSTLVVKKTVPNNLDLFLPVLEEYHKDHYYHESDYLYIHYPLLTLQNSLGHTHTIEDLIVKFRLNKDTGLITDLWGMRCSFSVQELDNSYSHSHLSGSPGGWNTFCMGSETPFQKFFNGLKKLNTAVEFEMFLIQLKEYLSWESLEGTPYVSISNFLSLPEDSSHGQDYGYDNYNGVIISIAKDWLSLLQDSQLFQYTFDPSLDESTSYIQEVELVKKYQSQLNPVFLRDWDDNNKIAVNTNTTTNSDSYELPPIDYIPHGLAGKVVPRLLPSLKTEVPVTLVKRFRYSLLKRIIHQINTYILHGLRNPINTEGSVVVLHS